jgi:hypothetical protein
VIVEVLTDTRQVRQDWDADLREAVTVANPRQQQDLRRVDSATADNDLPARANPSALAALAKLDPGAPTAGEGEPCRLGAVDQGEVVTTFQGGI